MLKNRHVPYAVCNVAYAYYFSQKESRLNYEVCTGPDAKRLWMWSI